MIKWLNTLINLILPPRCLICGKVISSADSLCSDCFKQIDFITHPYCRYCGKPLLNIETDDYICTNCLTEKHLFRFCRSAIKYDDFSKKLLLDFKFFDRLDNKNLLVKWLLFAGQDIFTSGADLIIPVPLHFRRLFQRKYNQSAVLAAELSKMTGIPADFRSLKKIKHTTPQIQCTGKQRIKNVKKAFAVVRPENIKGKRIILIDDVYTTGSTLKECTKVLKKCGAESVDLLTVSRVI